MAAPGGDMSRTTNPYYGRLKEFWISATADAR